MSLLALIVCLCACDIHFGTIPTPTPTASEPPRALLTVVWTKSGDVFAWREDDPTQRQIATTGAIQVTLAPDGRHVAFTRGANDDAASLWAVGIDGTGEQQLVAPDVLPSLRSGHPQINRVAWLDNQTVYFNTLQQSGSGNVNDDDLYRVELGGAPQLILPPGAGGNFALSPDGQQIAVISAGEYDIQKGEISLLDPRGVHIRAKLTFTALSAPSDASFYPPLAWNADSSSVRVPIPNREDDRVALWRIPVDDQVDNAQIFGYISAALDGLPVWSSAAMIYLRATAQAGRMDLLIAEADGTNERVYDSGAIAHLRWLPDGEIFAYDQDGAVWIGQRDQPPRALDIPGEPVVFAGGDVFVYAASDGLRYAHLSEAGSTLIDSATAIPSFDAGVAP